MKSTKFRKLCALVMAVLSLLTVLAACADQQGEPGQTDGLSANEAEYRVTVVNAKGQPYTSGIIVSFLQNGVQAAMQVIDETGTAAKVLPKGEYTVELMFTDSDAAYAYDKENLTLSADKTALEISLAQALGGRTMEMYTGGETLTGSFVDSGCTQVPLTPGSRSYFLFAPTEAGTYAISAVGQIAGIGCYGTPYYVQEFSICEVKNNSFTSSIRADMIGAGEGGSTVLVIGIDAGEADSCILCVERTGNPEWTPEDEPYVVYEPTIELAPYTLPEGSTLLEFDLTASTDTYSFVLDANGYYHLNSEDGPLVLVKLGVDNKYTACYKTMMTKSGVRAYFYDENGNFLRREDYYDCLVKYAGHVNNNLGSPIVTPGVMDEEAGVYPLTEDLKYIIQNHGRHSGWWDLDKETSIFRDQDGNPLPGINEEIAWLFMCAYLAQ